MKTKFLLTGLIILFCAISNAVLSQDVIVLTNGDEVKARVSEVGTTEIKYKKFENLTGPTYTMLKSGVFEIKYENGSKDIFSQSKTTPSVQVTTAVDSTKVQKPVVTINKPQKGSIKIYSELTGVNIYLDNLYRGTDIVNIDSISSGSHYLKATKDDVNIYGNLETITGGEVTTVLINNTKEVKEKLLSGKYKEQEEYKSEKIDIMIDTKYITESSGTTKSYYYPGYGSALLGFAKTNSTAVTYSSMDWFVTEGGNKKITEYEFATLTNNQKVINEIIKQNKRAKTLASVGAGFLLPGLVALLLGGYGVIVKPDLIHNRDVNIGLFAAGLGVGLIGFVILHSSQWAPNHYYDFDTAVADAKLYNQNLKKKLGLPEDFEPK